MKEIKIGMVGGAGRMGRFFQRLLPLEVASSAEEACAMALRVDVIIIGVPIRDTVEVIRRVAPLLREEQLLLDITSLKQEPCKAMLASKASVIGMHPLFGGDIEGLEGHKLILCPVRPGPWKEQVMAWFKGVDMIETTPEHHDQIMALVQALTHFATLSFMMTLKASCIHMEELALFTTPIFQMQLNMAKRILSGSSDLYAGIQMDNPYFPQVLDHFEEAISAIKALILNKDQKAFAQAFEELSRYV